MMCEAWTRAADNRVIEPAPPDWIQWVFFNHMEDKFEYCPWCGAKLPDNEHE